MAEERSIRMQNLRSHNRLSYRRRPQKHLFARRHLRPREECSALQQEMIGPRLSRLLFRFLLWIFFFFYRSPFFLNMSVSKFVTSSYTIVLSTHENVSHLLPADSLVFFDLMLLLLCCSTRTNHSLGDLFDVDIFKFFTFWSLGPVQVSLLRCIFLCV